MSRHIGVTRSRPPADAAPGGFTIIELIIALSVFAMVTAAALSFLGTQAVAYHRGTDRLTAMRNLSYAMVTLETDLTTAGTNVAAGQPTLVYADDHVIAFTADYATNVAGDVSAIYHDPYAPDGQVSAPVSAISIPTTGFSWPDTTYAVAGANSPAELIVFYLERDSSTVDRSDDWLLMRQVNGAEPEVVARSILKVGDEPFFGYMKRTLDASGIGGLEAVPADELPLRHEARIHGSVADTGHIAMIDSVKAVRIVAGSYNRYATGTDADEATLSRLVDLPNAGFGRLLTCGDEPILGSTLTAGITVGGTGSPAVQLSWGPSVDEAGGEEDVIRYVLWRRVFGGDWGDPFLSIPAGSSSYTYVDGTVLPGWRYQYALAAQDCTPSFSGRTTSGWILVP